MALSGTFTADMLHDLVATIEPIPMPRISPADAALLDGLDTVRTGIANAFGLPRFIVDPNVPRGVAYLIPPGFGRLIFERAVKLDMRRAWQRGPHPAPQTDDMHQMLADLGIDR